MHFIPDLISFINQRKWVENNLAEEQCIRLICFQLAALALLHCGCFSWRVTGCDNDELWGISTRQSVTQVLILRPRLIYQNKIREERKKKKTGKSAGVAAVLRQRCCVCAAAGGRQAGLLPSFTFITLLNTTTNTNGTTKQQQHRRANVNFSGSAPLRGIFSKSLQQK